MRYSEVKKLISELRENFEKYDIHEIILNMIDEEDDFEISNYRFINEDEIDRIQQEELEDDVYILGCFNAWFISDVLDIDQDVIEEMQKAGAYEAIGKLILSMNKLEELQEEYARLDGYGHHFAHYDGNENQINGYYFFKIN